VLDRRIATTRERFTAVYEGRRPMIAAMAVNVQRSGARRFGSAVEVTPIVDMLLVPALVSCDSPNARSRGNPP
jgi:hypothetical protein